MNPDREEAPDGLPIPPAEFHTLISGNPDLDTSDYLKIGRACVGGIRGILNKNGLDIDNFRDILDFGCGAARVIRHFNCLKKAKLYGTDINPELIDWCRLNLLFAEFNVNQPYPPLTYRDEKFDFIYAFSVFTHLPESLQFLWLNELSRVLRPGGHLMITTHGEAYAHLLSSNDKGLFQAGQLVVHNEEDAANPSTYAKCSAFHPIGYVKERLANRYGFDIIDFTLGQLIDADRRWIGQDVYLLRKR